MSSTFEPSQSAVAAPVTSPVAAASTQPLWLAIGALSVAVLGMGGMLIKGQMSTSEHPAATVAVAPVQTAEPTASAVASPANPEPMITEKAEPAAVAKAPVKPKPISKPTHTPQAAAPVAAPVNTPAPVVSAAQTSPVANVPADVPVSTAPTPAAPAVFQSQTKPLCINCGTVDSVNPVERVGHAVGVGAVAGGVLGAVVGNQVGQGSGRTVATILGALGGGLAGNTVERNMKKTTQYEIRVRMEDGTVRTFEQASPLTAGARVIIDNGVLHPAPRVTTPMEHSVVGGQTAPAKVYSTQ